MFDLSRQLAGKVAIVIGASIEADGGFAAHSGVYADMQRFMAHAGAAAV